ncbi:MAG: hypothetical protein ACFFEN_02005 [Candidatus Thorarchaeota archaeon]
MPTKFAVNGKFHDNKLEIETSPNNYVFFINLDNQQINLEMWS